MRSEKQMIVYIVFQHIRHAGATVIAVYDSEEKAMDYVKIHYPGDDSMFWLSWEAYSVY